MRAICQHKEGDIFSLIDNANMMRVNDSDEGYKADNVVDAALECGYNYLTA